MRYISRERCCGLLNLLPATTQNMNQEQMRSRTRYDVRCDVVSRGLHLRRRVAHAWGFDVDARRNLPSRRLQPGQLRPLVGALQLKKDCRSTDGPAFACNRATAIASDGVSPAGAKEDRGIRSVFETRGALPLESSFCPARNPLTSVLWCLTRCNSEDGLRACEWPEQQNHG